MKAIFAIVAATFFTAAAQTGFKLGAASDGAELLGLPLNSFVVAAFIFYGFAAVLFVFASKKEALSVIQPVWSLSYIWIYLVSIMLFQESITIANWFGVFLIMLGVSVIARGKKHD